MISIRKIEFSNEGTIKKNLVLAKKITQIDLKGKNNFCTGEVMMDISTDTKSKKICSIF